ncbi:MAG: hypothetical protein DRI77_03940 [Chloroflexi bacterium]|nr:MAG: hypothetical protein DRI77_03940 [Chloroflexota bacterium]
MTFETGQVLQNRYRIVSLLGQGGMGAVYRAWDTRLNIPIALKEMTSQPGLDPQTLAQLRQQFQQEATVLARLDHPNLVNVTDFFEEGNNTYLVMNFVAGESLADLIARQGTLPERDVLTWAGQLLDALAYCHDQGVLHRDIKPQNVIIRPDGRAMLVDFGLVKLWDPHDPRTRTAIRSMGTPEYAPPEQYDTAGHTDPRSDIYGLGATLYHALTGQSPPTATQRIVNPAILSPVRALNPQTSPHVETALTRALELRPEARFKNATEMSAALKYPIQGSTRVVAHPAPQRATGTRVVAPTPPTARRKATPWKWIVAGGAAILAVALLGGAILGTAWLFGDRPPTPAVADLASATPTGEAAAENVPTTTNTPISPSASPIPSDTDTPSPPSTTTSDTPPPTVTPQPTSTPLPTETPTPACPAVTGPFASIWQSEQARLGCATGAAHDSWMAQQHFEWGQMFWREDTDNMLAVHNSGIWGSYQDIWHEGDPEYSCSDSAPEESPPTPKRGFGKIWCTYTEVRNGLGWATDGERGFNGTVQDFERGAIIRTDSGETYVLFDDGDWLK